MKELEKFKSFLKKLDDYEDNVRTKEIKEVLNSINIDSPYIEKIQGEYYIIYKNKNLEFKFNTKTKIIEITKKSTKNNIEEITKATYEIISAYDSIRIIINSVVNCYSKSNDGYNLLLSGIKLDEFYSKNGGFQEKQKKVVTYCPNIIFRSNEDKEYCNFVTFNENKDEFIYVNLKTFSSSYYLSRINDEIKANPKECNNFVVFYTDDNHDTICFPAFYNSDKTLGIEPFIDNPLFQYSGINRSPYKSEDISFEGRTAEDFLEFQKNRKKILEELKSCYSDFEPLNKELDEIVKKLSR